MKLPRIFRQLLTLFSVGVFASGGGLLNKIYAAGVVSTPDQASLSAALQGGGLVTFECDGTIYLTNTITIGADTVLDGSGRSIAISGSNAVRVFLVQTNTDVFLSGISIVDGYHPTGAGLYNDGGLVTISNCSFLRNNAVGTPGINAVSNQVASTGGGNAQGGALYNRGVLKIFSSALANNSSGGGSGGTGNGYFPPQGGGYAAGAGVYNEGYVFAADTSFQTNSASGGNAAPWSQSFWGRPYGGPASSGAIYNIGELDATNCVFEANAVHGGSPGAGGTAGAICNDGGLVRLQFCSISYSRASGGGTDGTISPGSASGGAVLNRNNGVTEVSSSSFIRNTAAGLVGNGGACYNQHGTLSIGSSIISFNQAGSAAHSYRGQGGYGWNSSGGGIDNRDKLVLRDTVLNNNTALGGHGITGPYSAHNGGPAQGGALFNVGDAALTDCTVISNGVSGGSGSSHVFMPSLRGVDGQTFGAGIVNAGELALTNSTVAWNSSESTTAGGAAGVYTTVPILVSNSLVVSNEQSLRINLAVNSSMVGSNAVFSISGNNLPETGYQWFSRATNRIDGASGRTYTKDNLQAGDAGIYRVQIADSIGGKRSLFFNTAPKIVTQPSAQFIVPGGSATFSAEVEGNEPLFYQWQFDGADIIGATGTSYTLPSAQNENVGNYSLFVSNQFGFVTSSNAALLLITQPMVQTPLQNKVAGLGETVSFEAQISGNGFYQWYFQSSIIPGATNATYSFTAQPSRIGVYTVVLSNAVGMADSSAEFNMAPFISVQPTSSSGAPIVGPGDNRMFQVTANGSQPLSYQWRLNGAAIVGATGSSYAVESINASQTGDYSVVVSNAFGGVISTNIKLKMYSVLHWQIPNGKSTIWYFDDYRFVGSLQNVLPTMPTAWRRISVADLNGDNEQDYLWRHTNGAVAVWLMDGTQRTKTVLLRKGTPLSNSWSYVGAGDFNRDGNTDLLWQNDSRQLMSWFMNGTNFIAAGLLRKGEPIPVGWTATAAHDFDRDGNSDILLQYTDGRVNVWKMDRTRVVASIPTRVGVSPGAEWKVVQVHDFNYDGHKDILFRHKDGRLLMWCMTQTKLRYAQSLFRNGPPVSTGARLVGIQ